MLALGEPNKFRIDNDKTFAMREGILLDSEIQRASEQSYNEIVNNVVSISKEQLDRQNINKQNIRKFFIKFFAVFISLQFLALIILLALRGAIDSFDISDTLFTSYIVSVFVETLGVVAVMVKFAFDSKQEVQILSTLNKVVEHFQKYRK